MLAPKCCHPTLGFTLGSSKMRTFLKSNSLSFMCELRVHVYSHVPSRPRESDVCFFPIKRTCYTGCFTNRFPSFFPFDCEVGSLWDENGSSIYVFIYLFPISNNVLCSTDLTVVDGYVTRTSYFVAQKLLLNGCVNWRSG